VEIIAINGNRENFRFKSHAFLLLVCIHTIFKRLVGACDIKGLDQGNGTKISTVNTIELRKMTQN
jgi:hypothetical protein